MLIKFFLLSAPQQTYHQHSKLMEFGWNVAAPLPLNPDLNILAAVLKSAMLLSHWFTRHVSLNKNDVFFALSAFV